MNTITIDESYFNGAISLQKQAEGIQPWRIPVEELPLFETFGDLTEKAKRPSGVRLRFETDSPVLELEAAFDDFDPAGEPYQAATLTCDNEILENKCLIEADPYLKFQTHGDEKRVYELWLPTFARSIVRALRIADGAHIQPAEDSRLKWVTYGSSITHCRTAGGPAETWPATAARALDLNLTSLGFGGDCHLDSSIGRVIRDRAADLITLKLGINVYGSGSLNLRSFCSAAIGLVKIIREKHPKTPIGLITPIYSCRRETTPNAVGMTLENYREQLRRAFDALCRQGDEKLFLFEGTELLSEADAHLLPDELHPNAEGYKLMGRRAAEKFLPILLDTRE